MDSDRISVLEKALSDMQAREAVTSTRFEQLLAAISQNHSETPVTPSPAPSSKNRTVRPANPPDFDGDRSKGMAFLHSCQTYIRLCPREFADEQTKIVWAMSYMKSGRAQKWTARIFRWEGQPENADQTRFLDWDDFCTEFKTEFTPAHSDTLAINRLESAAYYQKNRPLDDYIDEFQDLVAESGYTDPKTIVVKFRRGLNAQIQNPVATMASGRPSDASPSAWYDMARTVDQNRAANEAFASTHKTSVPAPRLLSNSVLRPAFSAAKPVHAHTVPTPGNPVPMDLDAARKKPAVPTCFRCDLPGHFGRDCPNRFDVRTMTLDELQDALQERVTQLDVAEEPEKETEQSEDF
jgi:Retrotransposon gag protein/Zinc knuckle